MNYISVTLLRSKVFTRSVIAFRLKEQRQHSSESKCVSLPASPTNCCETSCPNCVWIRYAAKLADIYHNSDKASKYVLEQVKDTNLKAFLQLELKQKLPK